MSRSSLKKDWQAESDAYTLAEYSAIASDRARMARAVKAAGRRADALGRQADMMRGVASRKTAAAKPSAKGGRKK